MLAIRTMSRLAVMSLVATMVLIAAVSPGAAVAEGDSPLGPFLLKSGDINGFRPGKTQVFRTASLVKTAGGEAAEQREIKRYEAEGFVEAAIARIHGRSERSARGVSSVFEFESAEGAEAEMSAELKEELKLKIPRRKGLIDPFEHVRRFSVPGVPSAVVFTYLTNEAAARLGIESGVGKGLFIEGNCLLAVGIFRLMSKEVTQPVINGVQAVSSRAGGTCPNAEG